MSAKKSGTAYIASVKIPMSIKNVTVIVYALEYYGLTTCEWHCCNVLSGPCKVK